VDATIASEDLVANYCRTRTRVVRFFNASRDDRRDQRAAPPADKQPQQPRNPGNVYDDRALSDHHARAGPAASWRIPSACRAATTRNRNGRRDHGRRARTKCSTASPRSSTLRRFYRYDVKSRRRNEGSGPRRSRSIPHPMRRGRFSIQARMNARADVHHVEERASTSTEPTRRSFTHTVASTFSITTRLSAATSPG